MGYYTRYSLAVDSNKSEAIIDALRSKNKWEIGEAEFAIDENGATNNEASWYEHEKELREFSKLYPDTLFTLYGEGEQNGDIWQKHFRNGLMQECRAVITYPPFDESQLK